MSLASSHWWAHTNLSLTPGQIEQSEGNKLVLIYPFPAFMNDKGIRPCGCWLWVLRLKWEEHRGKLGLSCGSSDIAWLRLGGGQGEQEGIGKWVQMIPQRTFQRVLVSQRQDMSFCFRSLCVVSWSGWQKLSSHLDKYLYWILCGLDSNAVYSELWW